LLTLTEYPEEQQIEAEESMVEEEAEQ